jgi:hypothetical protein
MSQIRALRRRVELLEAAPTRSHPLRITGGLPSPEEMKDVTPPAVDSHPPQPDGTDV